MTDSCSVNPFLKRRDCSFAVRPFKSNASVYAEANPLGMIVDRLPRNFQFHVTRPPLLRLVRTHQSHSLTSTKGRMRFANSKWIAAERANQGMGQLMARALPEKGSTQRAHWTRTGEYLLGP